MSALAAETAEAVDDGEGEEETEEIPQPSERMSAPTAEPAEALGDGDGGEEAEEIPRGRRVRRGRRCPQMRSEMT